MDGGARAFFLGAAVLAVLLTGCASMVNGLNQQLEIKSDRPDVRVKLNKGRDRSLPLTTQISRREQGQTLMIMTPRGDSTEMVDTVRIMMENRFSHATWINLAAGYFGVVGILYDVVAGGAWRIDPDPRRRAPPHVHIVVDPDPWKTGEWRGSLAFGSGFKFYPDGVLPHGNVDGDLFVQAVAGHRAWPVLAETRGYFYSSLVPVDNFVIADVGVRKIVFESDAARPFVSGGLSLLAHSTQVNRDGLPLGVWARVGVDIRAGTAFFAAPYLGYAKHETVATGISTGGLTGGLSLGMLW